MDIFGVLTMVGGLAMFLYGMKVMGDSLAKMAGGKLERVLETLTSKRIYAVLLGLGVTAVIQSSSATTVMVVGFVNSGIMQLNQAVGIIMGANIGTTVTSWILSLAGIEGSTWWVKILKPSSFSPLLAGIGIVLLMLPKASEKKKDLGSILLGFAILMFGMETMSDAVAPLKSNAQFTSILTMFSIPVLGLLAGAVLTAIIQSSSASVGILQALCLTGTVSYATAIPIIMGQNIGTCVTAIISSIGAGKNAKRASFIHLYFNLIGTILFMIIFYGLDIFVNFSFLDKPATAMGIAIIHSCFNIAAVVVLYPFADKLVALATWSIKDKKDEGEVLENKPVITLDERFLERPAFAMEMCKNNTYTMAEEVKKGIHLAMGLLTEYDEEKAAAVVTYEQRVDTYEDVLGSYLVKLSGKDLSDTDSKTMSVLLHSINDLERISDHAINLQECALVIKEKEMHFSDSAKEELAVICNAVGDIVDMAVDIFEKSDKERAISVEPLEEVIDQLTKEIKQRHVQRLRQGNCSIEYGLVLEDILTFLERISDHCSNIAVTLIEVDEGEFGTHAYVERLKKGEGSEFYKNYVDFAGKYHLSEIASGDTVTV